MERFDIYKDIAKRTGGDIYVGVVGPVRTGKSSFITKFMELMVMPNISNKNKKLIATDEMPQSGVGKTITTTEPKFVPGEAVKITLKGKAQAKVRLIDCVGYLINGVLGDKENDEQRMVKTPWNNEPIPFEKAAEIGTKKVISEHSTIGVLVTTDGSIVDIPRENYVKAEERVAEELKACGKPFVIVLNCKNPQSENALALAKSLSDKYGVAVKALNALEMNAEDLCDILERVLMEFPMRTFDITLPKWMQVLPISNPIISSIISATKDMAPSIEKMKQYTLMQDAFLNIEKIKPINSVSISLGEGKAVFNIEPDSSLFYEMLSDLSGDTISDEYQLMSYVKELSLAKSNYNKLKQALSQVDEDGYGIVVPGENDMQLDQPIVVKQGGRYGVKIRANTSCMHMIKINLDAEVSPISGSEKQCKDFADYLSAEYQENPEKVWQTNIFGKPLSSLVTDEIVNKINCMREDTKAKMRKTVTRIVNEGKGGVICILL